MNKLLLFLVLYNKTTTARAVASAASAAAVAAAAVYNTFYVNQFHLVIQDSARRKVSGLNSGKQITTGAIKMIGDV